MKARISGTAYEVEVIPYFPEGMFAGFTDVSGKLQPGMIVYKSSDLEFIETPPKLKPDTDWEAFRREAAKDFTVALVSSSSGLNPKTIAYSIEMADELIKQLNEERK